MIAREIKESLDMTPPEAELAMRTAIQHHQAGRLQQAEGAYRQVLAANPRHADALHLLGVVCLQSGRADPGIQFIREAIAIDPNVADYHGNLGDALRNRGELHEALAAYENAVRLGGGDAAMCIHMGNILRERGKLSEAVDALRQAIAFNSSLAEAHNSLGACLRAQGKIDEAIAAYRQALRIDPCLAQAHFNLGNVLFDNCGQGDAASECFRRALELSPTFAQAHNNLGNVLIDKGRFDEAIAAYRQALRLKDDFAEAHFNLGNSLKATGELVQALACYDRAIALQGDNQTYHSNRLLLLNFHPAYDADMIRRELELWNQRLTESIGAPAPAHTNERSADRRLRIGYVSPDFRDHVVGRNILPLLREHDRRSFEIVCYADLLRPDSITDRFRSCCDRWRNVTAMTHEQLAQQICADGIDILVDLALHSGNNRLPALARKPAPVQITFAGYPGSTGLAAMDYRLSDPYLDPIGQTDSDYVERSIRLPDSFWCYDPQSMQLGVEGELEAGPLPALQAGHLTFGCLNNFCKINDQVLALWAGAMQGVANSKLLLLAAEGSHRQRVIDRLGNKGIAANRVEFVTRANRPRYLQYYRRIDVGLDTLPFNGHTTSLDSYWMGVPVVTLVGETVAARAGWSQLNNLGLTELAAWNEGEFIRLAVNLANDLPRLAHLRQTLRQRMLASPLTAARRFARSVEAAYRLAWRNYLKP